MPLIASEDAPFRARPPLLDPLAAHTLPALPKLESSQFDNGLTLWVVSRPQLPYVALSWVNPTASSWAADVPAELIHLTTRAMVQAGTHWPGDLIVDAPLINGYGVHWANEPSHSRLELSVVKPALRQGLELMARTIYRPAFDPDSLAAVQLGELKDIQAQENLASLLLRFTVEGALGETTANQIIPLADQRIRAATMEAIRDCHARFFRTAGSALILVGDVTFEEARALVEETFGSAGNGAPPHEAAKSAAVPLLSRGRRVHFLVQSERQQADVLVLQPAPPRTAHDDELPFAILTELAAGSFRSRANLALRHGGGHTYGVRGSTIRDRNYGLLVLRASFSSGEVSDAVEQLFTLFENLQNQRVTPAELNQAKAALAGRFERALSSNEGFSQFLRDAFLDRRDASWLEAFSRALAGVSADDVMRVAQKYLRPKDVEIGVAGGMSLRGQLTWLGRLEGYRLER